MNILITGGLGFIGSNFSSFLTRNYENHKIFIIDKHTYASDIENISKDIIQNVELINACIGDESIVLSILEKFDIDLIYNFAAESHVDNSINQTGLFVESNVVALERLLKCCVRYKSLYKKNNFRFIHISTDEVFGSIENGAFTESSNYCPSSPYSATKASADMIINSYVKTFDLESVIVHLSNNFGPHQHKEKLIPKTILNCLKSKEIPIYGTGKNSREWIYVEDTNIALAKLLNKPKHSRYLIGSGVEFTNNDIVRRICHLMNNILPSPAQDYLDLITYVDDRLGHDYRYFSSSDRFSKEFDWAAESLIEDALTKTIYWYINKYE